MRQVVLQRTDDKLEGMDGVHVYLPDGRVVTVYDSGETEFYVTETDTTPVMTVTFNAQA